MGLFDQVLGMAGQLTGGQGDMLQSVARLIEENGGLPALVEQFQAAGLGEVIASWMGTDANLPITPEQIGQVFSETQLGAFAEQFGLDVAQLPSLMAQFLPSIISQLAENGGQDIASQGLGLLGSLFNKG